MITRIINYSQRTTTPHRGPTNHPITAAPKLTSVHIGATMDLHLQPDWQRALGQRVEIWKGGRFVCKGTVDAVMPDDSLLWITAEGVSPRQMVFRDDGSQVFTHFLPPRETVIDH
jgi:hypothetical protein